VDAAAPRALIIDTDGGVDDCAAIWAALTDPGTEVVGITVTDGSVPGPAAVISVLTLLDAAGRPDVPVAAGEFGTLGPAPSLQPAAFIHGEDGQGNTYRTTSRAPGPEGAVELLQRLVRERPGAVSVLALAPLTNLGRVVAGDPSWAPLVDELVVMGGAIARPGNAQPLGEANIAGDPHAAAVVVGAGWARPPLLVPLDASHVATMTAAEFELLARRLTPAADFLAGPLTFYREFGSTFTRPDCPCHDLLALLVWAHPELAPSPALLPLAIQSDPGPAWGATVADRRAPYFANLTGSRQSEATGFSPWRIALEVDVDGFRARVRQLFGG
jgi:purine nucleosidase